MFSFFCTAFIMDLSSENEINKRVINLVCSIITGGAAIFGFYFIGTGFY